MTDDDQRGSYRGLALLLLLLAVGAIALNMVAGPPHLPPQWPGWPVITATLRGSSLPLGVLAYVLTMAAWIVWFWIVASLLLRLVVVAAGTISDDAGWIQTLRTISDRVTLPLVRRAVDGAVITVLVVNVVSRTVPIAGAASQPMPAGSHVATPYRSTPAHSTMRAGKHNSRPEHIDYTVQAGDTLWGIAERFYGTGEEFPRLVAANVGREMPNGERFTRTGVLQPGWVLRVPLPSQTVTQFDGRPYYVVEEGDTMRGIAARLLGDENRWRVLFDLNRDRASLDGHVLTDPNLIWPGLRLRLPPEAPQLSAAPAGGPPTTSHPRHHRPRPTPTVPTPTRARPTPVATRVAPMPTAIPIPTRSTGPAHSTGDETELIVGAVGSAAAVLAGGAVVLARRRVRRSLNEPPVPQPKPPASAPEFAETEPARVLRHKIYGDGVEPIVAATERVLRLLAQRGIHDVTPITVRQGHNSAKFVLRAEAREQEALLGLDRDLSTMLHARCRISVTADHDILLQISGLTKAGLLPATRSSSGLMLVPVGLLPPDEMLYANWRELGHVLVSGLPGGGSDIILTSLVAALTARRRPERLRLWTIADRRSLPTPLADLPHQMAPIVNPHDETDVAAMLARTRAELMHRMRAAREGQRWQASPEQPEIVLVVGELANLPDDGTTLELIGVHGPTHGVRILAASARAETIDDVILSHFTTRLVLQTMDDDESVRLLGVPEAADLAGGEFLLRIDGRRAERVRGFRVSLEHLEELIRLMREAYGDAEPATWPVVPINEMAAGAESPNGKPRVVEDEEEARVGRVTGSEQLPKTVDTALETPVKVAAAPEQTPVQESEREGLTAADVEEAHLDTNGHKLVRPADVAELSNVAAPTVDVAASISRLEVRCFGEFAVKSGDREITPYGEEGPSYKSWEILAFLASQPSGAISRDKLIAAIWPDATTDRAANRLHVALARLRNLLAHQIPDLPPDVVRVDREGMCRLDTTLVSSDVQRFASLIHDTSRLPGDEAKEALAQAQSLYRGDLLSGRGARFYEWIDERDESGVTLREHYREEYYRVTQRLARMYYEEGKPERAVPLYKSLLKAEPTLEDVVRELYRCYRELGDLNALIREDRHLRQALRDAYAELGGPESDPEDYQPEPETVALLREIREELAERQSTGR